MVEPVWGVGVWGYFYMDVVEITLSADYVCGTGMLPIGSCKKKCPEEFF